MRWEDERYVRLYTRDTVGWLLLSLEAQGLFGLILRKVDRAGILSLGTFGKRAVAVSIGHANRAKVIEKALDELLVDGCVQIRGEGEGQVLLVPNFIEAQEAPQSDAQRQRESRARARDRAAADAALCMGPQLTLGRVESAPESRNVTEPSHAVTPCHSFLAVPSVPSDPAAPAAGARTRDEGEGMAKTSNGAAAPERPAGLSMNGAAAPESSIAVSEGPAGPSMLERLRGAIAQALGIVGKGGVGIELGSSRRLGELIRNANEAVALRGFGLVVEACAAVGREMIARGDPPETMAAFGRPLRVLAAPDAEPQPLRHNGTYRPEPRRPELT